MLRIRTTWALMVEPIIPRQTKRVHPNGKLVIKGDLGPRACHLGSLGSSSVQSVLCSSALSAGTFFDPSEPWRLWGSPCSWPESTKSRTGLNQVENTEQAQVDSLGQQMRWGASQERPLPWT